MYKTISFVLLMLGYISVSIGQSITAKLQTHQGSYHIEKVYVSHDKPAYYPGDTIWAKVFFRDGRTHAIFDAQPVLLIEWLNPEGESLQQINLKIENGVSTFEIPIVEDAPKGNYTIRAYSQYQKNFDPAFIFQKQIQLLGADDTTQAEKFGDDLIVRFFPEGGNVIAGLPNRIAFKMEDKLGNPLSINGQLINGNGELLSKLQVIHEGMGIFEFTPAMGEEYIAQFFHQGVGREFVLPSALINGFTIQCKTSTKDYIEVSLSSNSSLSLAGCTLIGHIRGQIFLNQAFEAVGTKQLLIKKGDLPSGVVHFTLFDAQERPVCERLVFNRNTQEQISAELAISEGFFTRRSKVDLSFASMLNDAVVPSQYTVSVYNQDLTDSLYAGIDIVNYFLLQSDLRGRVKNIQQYFQSNDLSSSVLLDLLLMIHGWRRFKWQEVLLGRSPVLVFPTQDDLTLSGRIKKRNKDEYVKADVSLTVLSDADFMSLNLTTEEDGLFYFKGFQFEDTTDLFIQANIHNPKKQKRLSEGEMKRVGSKNVEIELLDIHQWEFEPSASMLYNRFSENYDSNKLKQLNQYQKIDSAYDAQMEITLDEVSITGRRSYAERNRYLKSKFKEKNLFFFASTYKLLMDDLPNKGENYRSIYDLVEMMVPRSTIQGSGVNREVYIRNPPAPPILATVFIDGVQMSKSVIQNLKPQQIEIIDVLEGLYASSAYGSPAVISIITRKPGTYDLGYESPRPKGVLSYQHPGYYQAREFYSPDYSQLSVNHQRPDFRTTLFWNGDGEIENEKNTYSFYTGDIPGNYLIKIEGITEDGIPFIATKRFTVLE